MKNIFPASHTQRPSGVQPNLHLDAASISFVGQKFSSMLFIALFRAGRKRITDAIMFLLYSVLCRIYIHWSDWVIHSPVCTVYNTASESLSLWLALFDFSISDWISLSRLQEIYTEDMGKLNWRVLLRFSFVSVYVVSLLECALIKLGGVVIWVKPQTTELEVPGSHPSRDIWNWKFFLLKFNGKNIQKYAKIIIAPVILQ